MPVKKEKEVYVIADEEERNPSTPEVSGKAPSQAAIAKLAFELYLARGGMHGHDVEDWLKAEHDLQGV